MKDIKKNILIITYIIKGKINKTNEPSGCKGWEGGGLLEKLSD